jgi:hypothetical protein
MRTSFKHQIPTDSTPDSSVPMMTVSTTDVVYSQLTDINAEFEIDPEYKVAVPEVKTS